MWTEGKLNTSQTIWNECALWQSLLKHVRRPVNANRIIVAYDSNFPKPFQSLSILDAHQFLISNECICPCTDSTSITHHTYIPIWIFNSRRPGRRRASSIISMRLVIPISRMLFSEFTPSILDSNWFTTESWTPVPLCTLPRVWNFFFF